MIASLTAAAALLLVVALPTFAHLAFASPLPGWTRRRGVTEAQRSARLAAIGQVTSGVIHDLRSPLTVISGYAELMGPETDESSRQQMVQVIMSQVRHIVAMQDDALAFARGERDVFIRTVHLREFASQLRQELEVLFKGSAVELELEEAYSGAASFDACQLRRALSNLALNAKEAMRGCGRFTLSFRRQDADLVIEARDTGPGLPRRVARRLGRAFVTQGKAKGNGLGLSMVKEVMDAHRGTLSVATGAGRGTAFELRFPLA